ncbi:MAG TPA: hypothetical protein VIV60_24085 [Polyangiaceae bacterium]
MSRAIRALIHAATAAGLWSVVATGAPADAKQSQASASATPAPASKPTEPPENENSNGEMVSDEPSPTAHNPADARRQGTATDSIEPSSALPAHTLEVMAIDATSAPAANTHIELLRERQSVSEGNSSMKWEGTTNSAGLLRFNDIPVSTDSQYRITAGSEGHRYGTRSFRIDSKVGTKVIFHVYPVVQKLRESLIAGRTFVFLEPRDDVLSIEFMAEFHNLGQTVLTAEALSLKLPPEWKAFATNPTDADLAVTKTAAGVSLAGCIAPGQHQVAFSFQIPSQNRPRLGLDLDLWPNTAEAQIATLSRPGLELQVEGFPNATVVKGNGRQPMLVTGKSFTHDHGPPQSLRLEVSGLPVIGPGRWYAVLGSAGLALGALLTLGSRLGSKQRVSAYAERTHRAARKRILQELAALMRAKREGRVGPETFAATQESLLEAFVRIERLLEKTTPS